jgi:type 2 lantibiotic biosynthesis protein LanM
MNKIDDLRKKIIEIVERASSISERLDDSFIPVDFQEKSAVVDSKIEQWCQVVADGNWKQFEKRLEWDGLDLKTVRCILGSVKLSNDKQLPDWGESLNDVIKVAASTELENLENETLIKDRFLFTQEPVPFEEFLLPFIYFARQKLTVSGASYYHLLSDTAHATLERTLLLWLSHLSSPSLELEFSVFRASKQSTVVRLLQKSIDNYSKQHYRHFIKGILTKGMLIFFQEYPVLARLMATVTNLWVDATKEFLCCLASDWSEIQKTFQPEAELGQVVAIKPSLSDRHNNGRSVMVIAFASGLKLVYKPKNLGTEQAYAKLLAWLNDQGIPLQFKILKVINRLTYGWVEFVEASSCNDKEEVRRYYQRAGMQLCLVHVLGAIDLHSGNIIACGEHPILIDLETLMHPRMHEFQNSEATKGAKSLAMQQLWQSVIRTNLLPRWEFGLVGVQALDLSGFGEVSQQEMVVQGSKWLNINTDAMMVRHENLNIQPRANTPSLHGINLSLNDYYKEIIDGFEQMYRFLMEQRQALLASDSPLALLGHQLVRFVFRHTRFYSLILKRTLDPKFMRDGAERSIQLDILSREMLKSDTKPLFWSLLKIEQQALEQMDIPLLTARSDSKALVVASNKSIDNCFPEPSFNLVVSYLNQLNNEDLAQQIELIRGSLYARTASETHGYSISDTFSFTFEKVTPIKQSEILQQAIAIAKKLQKEAINSKDNSATWIAPQYILESKRFQLQPMGYSLYDGSCGVALFLAALEKVTGGSGFRELALAALQPLCQDLRGSTSANIPKEFGIGGAIGCSSFVYVLVRISQFLKEPILLDYAKQAASLITPDSITTDNKFDIMSGTAGTIFGLLALHTTSPDSEVLEQAVSCGRHLLNNRVTSDSGYQTWATLDRKLLLTGFSHGAAGIAYALLRLYQATGEDIFLEAAQEAITYESSVFIPEIGNWPDFHSPPTAEGFTCMCSWCHGAPGIGLARVAGLDILDTNEIRQDIEVAVNTTKRHKLSAMDHLCCGNLGRVEFLFTAGRKLSQPQLQEKAMTQAAQVLIRAKQRGSFGYGSILDFHPGFFQGAAGIGYELLRLAYPDQLPSVLLWE